MKINKYSILIGIAVLAVVIMVGVILYSVNFGGNFNFLNFSPKMSSEFVAQKSVEYINSNILQAQNKTANLVSFSEESGLVKVNLEIDGQNYDSYVTQDGKLFFVEALEINLSENQ